MSKQFYFKQFRLAFVQNLVLFKGSSIFYFEAQGQQMTPFGGGLTPLQRGSQLILQSKPTEQLINRIRSIRPPILTKSGTKWCVASHWPLCSTTRIPSKRLTCRSPRLTGGSILCVCGGGVLSLCRGAVGVFYSPIDRAKNQTGSKGTKSWIDQAGKVIHKE